jgi:hypothetical protein
MWTYQLDFMIQEIDRTISEIQEITSSRKQYHSPNILLSRNIELEHEIAALKLRLATSDTKLKFVAVTGNLPEEEKKFYADKALEENEEDVWRWMKPVVDVTINETKLALAKLSPKAPYQIPRLRIGFHGEEHVVISDAQAVQMYPRGRKVKSLDLDHGARRRRTASHL